jgi:iron(III) transport system permease protein
VVWGAASVGWARAYELVVRPRVGELLVNTVALVVVTVPLCVVIGVALAWLVERTDLPGRVLWRPLFVAPLAVPAFVNSYAWVGVIPSLHGLWAGVLITTLSYFPFMYLPVAATLRRLDPAVEESARALGSASAGVFFRVVLPQLRLAILGGGLLIGVHLLAEYGAFAMVRFDTFTVAIFQSPSTVPRAACWPASWSCCVWCCCSRRRLPAAGRGTRVSAQGRPGLQYRSIWAATHLPQLRDSRCLRYWRSVCRYGRSCGGCGSAVPKSGTSPESRMRSARPSHWPPSPL